MEIPDLNDVRTFVMVGQEGTLTAAAKKLGVPVSTVSRSLTRLEKRIGVLLVQRSPRGLTLTDSGKEYLNVGKRALRTLRDGSDLLESRREHPQGLITVACPVTMAHMIFAPLLKEFLDRYPDLRLKFEPYASDFDQEPREDVDVFFKVRAPRDSIRRVRPYPGTKRSLFASPSYIAAHGSPATPEDLTSHTCIGAETWKLTKGSKVSVPNISFRVESGDPAIHLAQAIRGLGITMLPLYIAKNPDVRDRIVPVLPLWNPETLTLCALFSGPARLTPKVQVLLDFLGEYIGTDRDPRLNQLRAKGLFTDATLTPMSGSSK